ncbi:MAG: DUF2807 domain-containing protein [Alphaproteobacteria bacterium]|nr:DUF2807 domain-containing protein [Alphaproteobacteria bacterium]
MKARLWMAAAPAAIICAAAASAGEQTLNQTFQTHRLQIDALIAHLTVNVQDGASGMNVAVDGTQEMVQKLRMTTSGDALVLSMDGSGEDWWSDMWDWTSASSEDLTITVTVGPGTPVKVANFIGDATVGDIRAEIEFNSTGGETSIGEVTDAEVAIAGSGDISLARATGKVEASIAGSGTIRTGDTGDATVEIAGGGDIIMGVINGGLNVDVAGSGEVTVKSVSGKVDIDVAGSGDVRIDGGNANPFRVDIAGSGDVRFGGTAHDPNVSVMGSGDVWIAAYTGTLSSDGADIKIGQAEPAQ